MSKEEVLEVMNEIEREKAMAYRASLQAQDLSLRKHQKETSKLPRKKKAVLSTTIERLSLDLALAERNAGYYKGVALTLASLIILYAILGLLK